MQTASPLVPARSALLALLGSVLALATPARGVPAVEPPVRQLTLGEALGELESHNLTLAEARSRIGEARGLVRQALAALLPAATATGSYTRNSEAARAPIGSLLAAVAPGAPPVADLVIQPLEVWNATGLLRVPLVLPSAWADLAAARHGAAGAEASAEAARLRLRAGLVQAAWAAAAAEEVVGASERARESAQEQARSAQRAQDAGTGAPLPVLQARSEALRRESDLVRARAELARARLALGVLLGGTERLRIPLAAPQPPPPIDAQALAEEALGRRPELKAAQEQVEAAERQVDAALLRTAPQLAATGAAFAQDVAFPTGKTEGWRVGVELSWPLYDGGFRYGKRRQAEAALAGARAAAAAQRIAVVQEVEDASREVSVAAERLALAQDQQRVAAEASATARRGFDAGVASSLDVLDASDRLFMSEVGLAEARARLGSALAALERAAGRG